MLHTSSLNTAHKAPGPLYLDSPAQKPKKVPIMAIENGESQAILPLIVPHIIKSDHQSSAADQRTAAGPSREIDVR